VDGLFLSKSLIFAAVFLPEKCGFQWNSMIKIKSSFFREYFTGKRDAKNGS